MRPLLGLPDRDNSFYDDRLRFDLDDRLIFVFGSNEAGRHGAGAAKEALEYGATYGIGYGLMGNSYGIPTKDRNLNVLPLKNIQEYVDHFKEVILEQQDHYFYITPFGTGRAGYRHSDIAPMIRGVKNCWLPLCWKPYL